MEQLLLVEEVLHHVAQRHQLAEHRRQGGAPDAHAEREDEQVVQQGVGGDGEQGQLHREGRIALGADDAVEAEVEVRDDVAEGDDQHVVPGVGEDRFAGAEKAQDRIHEKQTENGKDQTDQDVEGQLVGEHAVRRQVVLLPEQHGDHRGGADADQGAEGRRDVHQREADGDAGDGQAARPGNVPEEGAVDHVVEGGGRHRDDGGDGETPEQGRDAQGAEFGGGAAVGHPTAPPPFRW